MPSFTSLPYEIYLVIIHELVDSFHTAPELLNVLLLCHSIHDLLVGAPANGIQARYGIFSQLFHRFFDSAAPIRRLNDPQQRYISNAVFADIWKRRCRLLRKVSQGVESFSCSGGLVYAERLVEPLWEIYFMLLDDDGRNMQQLDLANAAVFLHDIIYLCLTDQDENEWPRETIHFQLAAACFSIVSDRDVRQTSLTASQYPSTLIPLIKVHKSELYDDEDDEDTPTPAAAGTLPSIANMRTAKPATVDYFGHHMPFTAPQLLPSITCIILNRMERKDMIPHPSLSADRDEAISRGLTVAATKADWAEINLLRRLAIGTEVPRAGSGRENLTGLPDAPLGSVRWDHMFERMRGVGRLLSSPGPDPSEFWYDSVYQPGMFSGNWLGRFLVPEWEFHTRLLEMHPQSYSAVFQSISDQPPSMAFYIFQATLKEHVCNDSHIPFVGGQGIDNAYLPFPLNGHTHSENIQPLEDGVMVTDTSNEERPNSRKFYRDWDANADSHIYSQPSSSSGTELRSTNCSGTIPTMVEQTFAREGVGASVPRLDIIVTGEPDRPHGLAWGQYKFYGRVRKLDGLLVLVRVSALPNQDNGCWVFSGYVHLANVIIGSWKAGGTPVEAVGMQSIFLITKVGPVIQIEDPYYRRGFHLRA